ncbi:thioredoxin [Candidatus Aerophobetes bacterium]|uniref:Thioredoxin n=1 Tax=Aerophobetes bacterium TaxID=2030807 RepID=A0A2A4X1L6_UNCAE|nr:MAG: thioredoxin [Candidatus Aerophobetes bacterium]
MANLTKLGDDNFEQTIENGVVLVDFFAHWCGPCKALTPVLEEMAGEMSGKVTFAKLDIDEGGASASKYQVTSVPTLILFKEGKEVDRLVGLREKEDIKAMIEAKL